MTTNNPSVTEKCPQHVLDELVGIHTEAGHVDLARAATVVEQYSGTLIPLKTPKGYSVRVCGQDGTVYDGNEEELEAWKDFYLPERMEMVVIGAVDEFPCEAFDEQLVLLLCEDGKVYAYEDEVLHLVATSLKELFKTGMNFPGLETYKLGECFKDYTEEQYNKAMESEDMKKILHDYHEFRKSLESRLMESLKGYKKT